MHQPFSTSLGPYGVSSKKRPDYWNRLVQWGFLGCLVLFLRAFLPCGTDCLHLPQSSVGGCSSSETNCHMVALAASTSISTLSSPKESSSGQFEENTPNHNATLDLSLWNSASPANTTAKYRFDGAHGEVLEEHGKMDDTRGLTLSPTPDEVNDAAPVQEHEMNAQKSSRIFLDEREGGRSHDAIYSTGHGIYVHSSEMQPQVFDPNYDSEKYRPFLSLEEVDEDGQTFVLKIWIDKERLLRGEFGRVEICGASSAAGCQRYD